MGTNHRVNILLSYQGLPIRHLHRFESYLSYLPRNSASHTFVTPSSPPGSNHHHHECPRMSVCVGYRLIGIGRTRFGRCKESAVSKTPQESRTHCHIDYFSDDGYFRAEDRWQITPVNYWHIHYGIVLRFPRDISSWQELYQSVVK